MKKRKMDPASGRKNDTEFSSPLTPDLTGGGRSLSHPSRWGGQGQTRPQQEGAASGDLPGPKDSLA